MASPMARQPPVPATSKGLLLSASSSSPPNEPGDSTRKDGGVPETPTKKKSKIHHMGRGELLNEKLQHVTTPREPIQDEGFFSGDVGERREVEQPRLSPQQLHASVCKKPITLIARNFSYAVRLKVPCIPRDCCCRGGSRRGMNVKETTKGRRASSLGSHPTTPSQRSPGGQEKRYDCLPSENHHKGDPQGELGELQQPSLDGIDLLDRDGKGENKETEESRKASTTKKGEKKEGHLEDLEAGRNRSHYGGESDVETSQRQGNGKEEGYERDSDEDRGKEGGQLLGGGLSSNEGGQFDTKERARVHETSGGEGQVKAILSDIDLYAKPGEMLVIMGPSGSGKTTLLNALAGRSLPSSRVVQNGDILYLGLAPGETLSNISTYVMQKDKVPELLTVHEYITFFSKLKMKDSTDEERAARVEVVLKELGLWRSRHTRVGGSAQKGLSGGEIKRLALAVELLHDPSLIFLDEPTSGLDAALAFETMKLLLRLARQGRRTIVCTIHQPRSQLFAMFDRLILMFEGRIVYQGPARRCVSYFARRGFHCPPQFNPADFILDLLTVTNISAGAPLACPQSDASLDAQSQLEAELEQIHHEEHRHERRGVAGLDGESGGVEGERNEALFCSEDLRGKVKAHSSSLSYDVRFEEGDNRAMKDDKKGKLKKEEMGSKRKTAWVPMIVLIPLSLPTILVESFLFSCLARLRTTDRISFPVPSDLEKSWPTTSIEGGRGGGGRGPLWLDLPYGDVRATGYSTDREGKHDEGLVSSSFSSPHSSLQGGGKGDPPRHVHPNSRHYHPHRGPGALEQRTGSGEDSDFARWDSASLGDWKGSGSGIEMRKAVSVLSVASSLAMSEGMVHHSKDPHRKKKRKAGEGDHEEDDDDEDTGGAWRPEGMGGAFLDAEEQGEIHRVFVAEKDVRALVDAYAQSENRREVKKEIELALDDVFGDKEAEGRGKKERRSSQLQLARMIGAGAGRLIPRRRGWTDWWREVWVLLQINFLNLFRNPMSSLVQLGLNIFLGIISGVIFFNIPGQGEKFESARNTFGILFFLSSQFTFSPLDSLVLFCEDRELFNRDTANGNYSASAYFVAKSLANIPFQHTPLTCLMIIAYWMYGLYSDVWRFLIFLAIGQLSVFASASLLACVSSGSPRIAVAQAVAPMVLLVFVLVGGFYTRSEDIPAWIRWIQYISCVYYTYSALALNQFHPDERWGDIPNDTLLSSYGGLSNTDIGFSIGLLALLGCFFRFLSFFFLKYTNRRIGLEA